MKKTIPNNIAISVKGLTKSFVIPHEKITTLRGAFVNIFNKKTHEEFKVFNNVSFDVKKGEVLGVIGPNGRGKSTLLKMIAGVYTPDSGTIDIDGKVSPFLELGVGFNPELSGKDNVLLNGVVLGLSIDDMYKKFDEIVDFAGVRRFIDQKVKNYSSGMRSRLAFSVALHAHRDILLLDEALAVGDAEFQQKCLAQFEKYKQENKTIVFVSHSLDLVQKHCDRTLLINSDGSIIIGDTQEVLAKLDLGIKNTQEPKLVDVVKPVSNMLLSIHIPKTAGTTFGEVLSNTYAGRMLYVYWHNQEGEYWVPRSYEEVQAGDRGLPESTKTLDEICKIIVEEDILCVHGHISLPESRRIIDACGQVGKDVYTIAFVRDPVERAISEIRHHKRQDPETDHDYLVDHTANTLLRFLDTSLPNLTICHSENFAEEVQKLGYIWNGVERNKGDLSIVVDKNAVQLANKQDVDFYNTLQ